MSDDYEAAIDGGMEPESPTGDAPQVSDEGGDDFEPAIEGGSGLVMPRRGRVISDKVRQAFALASKSVKDQLASGEDDDFEPAIDPPSEPVARGVGSESTPPPALIPQAAQPAPAPSLDPAVLAKVQQLDARNAELDAREKAIADRQAAQEVGDFGRLRETYFDKGGAHAIVELVKLWTGASTDTDVQDEIADLITELSGHSLGVQVPQEVKTRLDAKRALKGVKSHQAKLDAREAEIAKKQTQASEQANIQRAITALDTEVRKPELATQFPFLTVEPNAGELIFETVEAQFKRGGVEMKWTEAAKLVNDYLETKWREEHGKRAHLLSASPAKAGGVTAGMKERPQGDPTGNRRSQTLTNAQAASAPTPPRNGEPPNNGKWSAEDHRNRTKAKMRAAFKPSTP